MTYAAEVLADSPDGFWLCDDGSGAPQDSSGNANHATLTSGANTYIADGTLGTVLDADAGTWDLPVTLGGSAWTIEFCYYTTAVGSSFGLHVATETGGDTAALPASEDDIALSTSAGGPPVATCSYSGTFDSAWHHVVGTWDGSDLVLYLDGAQVDTAAYAPGTFSPSAGCTMDTGGDSPYLVSGVAIYPTALSAARVAAHYDAFAPDVLSFTAVPAVVEVEALTGVYGVALTSVDADPAIVEVGALTGAFGQRTVPVATPAGQAAVWSVHSATMTGSTGEIQTSDGRRGATCTRIVKRINSIEFSVDIPPHVAGLDPISDEVQVYRNGHLHAWGPVISPDDDTAPGRSSTYPCRDPSWYLERTVVGDPERVNFLTNPSFEDGITTGWTIEGPCMRSEDTTYVARGDKACRLVCATDEADAYIENSFVHDNTAAAYGYWYYAKAWCYIDEWNKAAKNTFGLWIRYTNGTVTRDAWAPLNAATPRRQYVPLEAKVLGEPHSSGIVTLRLYAPNGAVVWDAAQVVGNNFTGGTSTAGTDQALMAAELVRVAQFDPNKSDKKIGRACPATGKKYRGIFEHSKHAVITDALRTVLDHEDGADWWVDVTPGTRTFRTAYPYRTRTAPDLSFETGGNALHAARHRDGSQAASAIIMQGPGDGPAREEGGAINDSAFGGKILDAVLQAPAEAPLSRLDQLARDELARGVKIPTTVTFTVAGDLVDAYEPGDTCQATVDWGHFAVDTFARVQEVSIDPVADTAEVTVTEWPAP